MRSMSIAGALDLYERGVFTVHDPTTRRLAGALEPERHGLPPDEDALTGDLEIQCECGRWIVYPRAGEVVECECGTKFEVRPTPEIARKALGDDVIVRTPIVRERRGHGHSIAVRFLVACLVALALAAPATASTGLPIGGVGGGDGGPLVIADPCAKVYPAPPTVEVGRGIAKRRLPLHPIMLAYVRCVRGQR